MQAPHVFIVQVGADAGQVLESVHASITMSGIPASVDADMSGEPTTHWFLAVSQDSPPAQSWSLAQYSGLTLVGQAARTRKTKGR
jgi:hypothetical protein